MAICELYHHMTYASTETLLLQTGEIDIIEGVHDNEHNQVAWHTYKGVLLSCSAYSRSHCVFIGCYLNPNGNFTGQVVVSFSYMSAVHHP